MVNVQRFALDIYPCLMNYNLVILVIMDGQIKNLMQDWSDSGIFDVNPIKVRYF